MTHIPEALRAREAAARIGIGRSTFLKWVKEKPGFVQPTRLSPRTVVFMRVDLDTWLEQQVSKGVR